MLKGHPHICLYQPEIPQNAGNIGRLAAATGSRLHFIEPFGFDTADKNLRRAGLDYWPFLDLEIHRDFNHFASRIENFHPVFFSKKGTKSYYDIPDTANALVFGRETSGLPDELWQTYPEHFYQIPIYHEGVRSLNLANSVSIAVYHFLYKKETSSCH